ncbi:hypothetical protein M8C21_020492 [Ambrosia artemisiifolia]|uniref:CAAX prenyl protease n=1 Tax=Ambrosia artemisiifolia TaxID=4212 RepID=A0AAD5CQX5_AMBAR|nr:hypothetical protein M8C21_020492 [Ambrosia artemisiifolia]
MFEKYRDYNLDKSTFHLVKEFVTIVTESVILFFGFTPWLWKKSGDVLEIAGLDAENEIYQTLAFLAGAKIWYQITDLPFSLFLAFVIEEDHGFNKQTIWMFIRDMFKDMIVAIILGPPYVAAIILILPLPQGELRTKIETLASSLNFPLKNLYVDRSTRSSDRNVYMYGLFKNQRIVLFNTLIQQCKSEEEVVAVIAHELGHWKMNHTTYSFIAFQLTTMPIQHLVSFGRNLLTRAFDFQADAFAMKLGYAKPLRDRLVQLQEGALSEMNTDPWYSAYHYSSPLLVERVAALDEADKKED